MKKEKRKWGIIGGGMMGMTLAHRLAQQGQSVTLFEGADQLGGLTATWQLGDVIWDKYYHVTLMSDTYFRNILKEIGLDDKINWVETKTGFYTDGKLYSMSNSFEFLKFPPLSLIDKFRLGLTIFYASKVKDWKSLEGLHVADWLTKWSGKNTFNKIWLPLLRAKLGENYRHTSAAFIWATIQRMYAARRTGLKKEMFGYLPGGYATLLDTFAQTLDNEGVNIQTSHRASRVRKLESGLVEVEFQSGKTETFDEVILTLPAKVAASICEGFTKEEHDKLTGIQYLGVVCASLLLKKKISKFYVTNVTDDNTPFTGIIEMTAMVDPAFFGGNTLIYLPKYVKADHPDFLLTDEQLKDRFWGKLLAMYPQLSEDDLLEFKVSRARNVFALSTLNYSEKLPPISMSVPGIHVLNSAHIANGTLNVNETIQLAEKELPKILEASFKRKKPELAI